MASPKHQYVQGREIRGRMCVCGNKAVAWLHGYVCERCRTIENNSRELRASNPRIKRHNDVPDACDTYTVHIKWG